jgi:hypothetical protein
MDRQLALTKELWQKSIDPEVRAACLQAIELMHEPEAQDLRLAWMNEALRMRDDRINKILVDLAGGIAASNPRSTDSCVEVLLSVLRNSSNSEVVTASVWASFTLPVASMTQVLEQARAQASHPIVKDSITKVLAKIQAGETREDHLRETFRTAAR